jgi:hypothetical protein
MCHHSVTLAEVNILEQPNQWDKDDKGDAHRIVAVDESLDHGLLLK